MRRSFCSGLLVLAGCSSAPHPGPVPPAPTPRAPSPAPLEQPQSPPAQPLVIATPPATPVPGTQRVTIKVSSAASRQPEHPRVLRRLIAQTQGKLSLAKGPYREVGLYVEAVVSGTLDDPSYASRPIGTNHLSVTLLDEAAFAADDSLAHFEGTWTLTRWPDGTLTVSDIKDTPYGADKAVERTALLERARRAIRGTPTQRLEALDILAEHAFLELVPDVIALLDDTRTGNANGAPAPPSSPRKRQQQAPRVVAEVARQVIRTLVEPFSSGREPTTDDVGAWTAYWRSLLAGEPKPRTLTPTSEVVLDVPMNQSWPEIVGLPDGVFGVSISRMQTPVDRHTDGLALTVPPYTSRVWLDGSPHEELDMVVGPAGAVGVLSAGAGDQWRFWVVAAGKPNAGQVVIASGKHAAIAAGPRGYLAAYIRDGERALYAQPIDPEGRPRGAPVKVPLGELPAAWYHRGFHALKLARHGSGWLASIEFRGGVLALGLDDKLAPSWQTKLATSSDFSQPKLALSKDRAAVVWTQGRYGADSHVGIAVTGLDGKVIATSATTGSEVWDVSKPVALADGGFAVAWIEAGDELHLGRWTEQGVFVGSARIARDASFLTLTLSHDRNGLVVGYEDLSRYPYRLTALHVDPAKL